MSFERPKSSNEARADLVMELIRDQKFKNVPDAVRYILINELITNESDVRRIMQEIGFVLQRRRRAEDEEAIWKSIDREEMLRGAAEAARQRGGDPED